MVVGWLSNDLARACRFPLNRTPSCKSGRDLSQRDRLLQAVYGMHDDQRHPDDVGDAQERRAGDEEPGPLDLGHIQCVEEQRRQDQHQIGQHRPGARARALFPGAHGSHGQRDQEQRGGEGLISESGALG